MNTSDDSMIDKITEMMENLIWLEWQKEDEMELEQQSKQVKKPVKRTKSKSPKSETSKITKSS